jgi:hypothetical protein
LSVLLTKRRLSLPVGSIFILVQLLFNIKMRLKRPVCEVLEWIHLVEQRIRWRAVLNTLMNPEVE